MQFCIFHLLWNGDTTQTKVSVSNQILPDNAYQPALYFAHCGANLLSYQWHFFKERGDFLETRPHATSIAYYRIGKCSPSSCFNTDAMEDVLRVRLKIKTAHLCCLHFIYKLKVFFNVCFHLESRRECLQVIHESLGLCWVQPGRDRDHASTIRDSHAESLTSLVTEIDVPQLLQHLRLCFWGGKGWGAKERS